MKKLLAALLLILPVMAYAAVYKWTDEKGNVHFSDTPHQGAKKIEVPKAQTFTPVNIPSPIKPQQNTPQQQQSYKAVQITQPEDEATIRNNNGYVAVSVRVDPGLFEGDLLQLYFDGTPVGKPQTSTVFVLNNIYRGEHNISVAIIGANGKQIMKSESVTIFMHRARAGQAR